MEDIIEKTGEAFKLSAAEIGIPRVELGYTQIVFALPLSYIPLL